MDGLLHGCQEIAIRSILCSGLLEQAVSRGVYLRRGLSPERLLKGLAHIRLDYIQIDGKGSDRDSLQISLEVPHGGHHSL